MKLASYIRNKQRGYGVWTEGGIIDLSDKLGKKYPSIKALLEQNALSEAYGFINTTPDTSPDDVQFLPVIDNPNKIICAGMNYAEKRLEFNELNPEPTLFVRFPDSQTGHRCPVIKPAGSREFDYEGELAVIIGKPCFHVDVTAALEYVAGYSCYMDGSARDWQHTWYTAGKNWPATGAFGPYMVTLADIGDPQSLAIKTWLNGRLMQNDNTRNMIHDVAHLISYISTFTPLSAGDVIITGSPGGVGKKRIPPVYLQPGDCIEVEIEGIGRLTNMIYEEQTVPVRPELDSSTLYPPSV
ncbi:fumarylacetoacetate hydrolase family protein [Sodalis sp. C49]|uniref:fumarylacetoacetate hydrolase family protein n=1 Tax=Sodalis sp. C49 TaxID=3228929 RepID=UPI003965A09D